MKYFFQHFVHFSVQTGLSLITILVVLARLPCKNITIISMIRFRRDRNLATNLPKTTVHLESIVAAMACCQFCYHIIDLIVAGQKPLTPQKYTAVTSLVSFGVQQQTGKVGVDFLSRSESSNFDETKFRGQAFLLSAKVYKENETYSILPKGIFQHFRGR